MIVSSFQSVLRLLVSPQIHLSLETFAAEVAAERFVSGVFPAVRYEVGALAERLPAHLAFVWLFTCVDEGVFLHVRLLMEPFAAVLAWVRPRVGVDKQVSRQS